MPAVPAHIPGAMPDATGTRCRPYARSSRRCCRRRGRSRDPRPCRSRACRWRARCRSSFRLPRRCGSRPWPGSSPPTIRRDLLASHVPAAGPVPVESMPAIAAFEAARAHPAAGDGPGVPPRVAGALRHSGWSPVPSPWWPRRRRRCRCRPSSIRWLRIAAQPAGAQPERPTPEIPTPGPFALEYFCQRIASVHTQHIEPLETRLELQLQRFAVPPAAVPYQDMLKKQSRLVLPFEEIFAKRERGDEKRGRRESTRGARSPPP